MSDPLRKAVEAFLAKWELVLPALNSAALAAHIHGMPYSGPTIGEEVEALRIALRLPARTDFEARWEAEAKRTERDYPERAMAIRHVLQDLRIEGRSA